MQKVGKGMIRSEPGKDGLCMDPRKALGEDRIQ